VSRENAGELALYGNDHLKGACKGTRPQ